MCSWGMLAAVLNWVGRLQLFSCFVILPLTSEFISGVGTKRMAMAIAT